MQALAKYEHWRRCFFLLMPFLFSGKDVTKVFLYLQIMCMNQEEKGEL